MRKQLARSRRATLGLLLVLLFGSLAWPESAPAQWGSLCPPGSTPVPGGGGMMCQCPDGSFANYGQACAQAAPMCPQGTSYCSNARLCCNPGYYCSVYGCTPHGAVDCSGYYCNPGQQCGSARSCMPAGVVDCGQGRHCPAGRVCWKAPVNVAGIRKGELNCFTQEQASHYESLISEERDAEKRRKAEAEADRRRAEAQRKSDQEAKKLAEKSKLEAQLAAKHKTADALAHQKASAQLQMSLEKQRQVDLQRAALQRAKEQQQIASTKQCPIAQIYDIACPDPATCPPGLGKRPVCAVQNQISNDKQIVTGPKVTSAQRILDPAKRFEPSQIEQRRLIEQKPETSPPLFTPPPSTFEPSPAPKVCSQPENIDGAGALRALPYGLMARDAYESAATSPSIGIVPLATWDSILRNAGVSDLQINALKLTGFSATLYQNTKTGEVTIAYRGSQDPITHPNDWVSNYNARISAQLRVFFPGYVDPQYQTADDLARIVKQNYSKVSLTGHSLGGGLASYAGKQHGIEKVYTFNAARNPFSTGGSDRSQVNINVAGDNVGDPGTATNFISGLPGSGCLPGRQYFVNTLADQSGLIHGLEGSHNLNGLLAGLSDMARSELRR